MTRRIERAETMGGGRSAGSVPVARFGPDGSMLLDMATGEVRRLGSTASPQALTASELVILKHLCSKKSHSATVDELYSLNHGGGADSGTKDAAQRKRSIQQHMCNIRVKIAKAGGPESAIVTNRATKSYQVVVPDAHGVVSTAAEGACGAPAAKLPMRRQAEGVSRMSVGDFAADEDWCERLSEEGVIEIANQAGTVGWLVSDEGLRAFMQAYSCLDRAVGQARIAALAARLGCEAS